MLNRLFI